MDVETDKMDVIADGERYRQLSSGAIQDLRTGRIVRNIRPTITKDNARQMLARREALKDEATIQAIIDGTGSIDFRGGWQRLTEALISIIQDGSDDKARVQAYKAIKDTLFRQSKEGETTEKNTITLSDDGLKHMLDLINTRVTGDK